MAKNYLITGAAGFIGHHIVDNILRNSNDNIIILDRLDESGNLNRLAEIGCPNNRAKFIYHNLRAPINDLLRSQIGHVDIILHLAAATHVDRSIDEPAEFVMDNVLATCHLLDFARKIDLEQFVYFGTDEVFGPAPEGVAYSEWDRYKSGNPYAATKAGAEELCVAYHNTYNLPVKITHCMNVFGERQHPEKFIPMVVSKVLKGEPVTIHADAKCEKAGSRFYIHARNVADAIGYVIDNGYVGEKFNIVGELEVDNLHLAQIIAGVVGKPLIYEMVDFHSSRPGHDLRYALDGSRLCAMGWTVPVDFVASITKTIEWTLKNDRWLF